VNFFEHFSRHLSKHREQLDRWCKNVGIQEKLRVGIDDKSRLAATEFAGIDFRDH